MQPTVKLGSIGPAVRQLQEALNTLPSKLPKLGTDGQFGGQTLTRVKEFQGGHGLTMDGVVGPATWQKLLAQPGQTGPRAVALPPDMPAGKFDALRPAVLAFAQQQMGKVDFSQMIGGKPKGLDFLIEMFKFTANVQLTDANFRKNGTGNWHWIPWVGLKNQEKSWCGIFVVHCYRKAGLPVSWDLGKGGPVGPLAMASFSQNFVAGIKPGDMGAVATQSHHFLIESVGSGALPPLTTIDGNLTFGRIERRQAHHKVGKDNFNYYKFVG